MAVIPQYIADKSALARLRHPDVDAILSPLILAGEVATCSVIELEVLYSARTYADFVRTRQIRSSAFPLVDLTQADFHRAIDIMEELARRGQHRAARIPDLLIAAVAEREGLTILHYDGDFDLIASVTGQPANWIAPRGAIP